MNLEDPAIDWFRGLARMTGGPVLELGIGSGRIAIPLAKDGHEVVGIDRSPAMLARAAKRAKEQRAKLTVAEADMRTFSLERTFALVTIPANTFLMLEPDDRWACLARCREHLSAHGRLAIDVFQPNPEIIASRDGTVRVAWRRTDPDTGHPVTKFTSEIGNVDRVDVAWWFDEELPDGAMKRIAREATLHYLYRREAELLFPAAGFEIDSLHGSYEGGVPTASSSKLLFVLRRKERGTGRERRRR